MSWPNSWQVQPGYAGYATAAAPPSVAPVASAAAAALPGGYSAMTPEQYAQWQQWQQYQQQYAQWHAQYGEQYARQMGKPLPAVPAPMPLQHMGLATNVPPPAVAMAQPVPAPVVVPTVVPTAPPAIAAVVGPVPPVAAVAPPIPTISAAPPPPSEPHPDSVASQAPAPPPPASDESEQSQKTTEELAFDEQFRKWEEEFDNWKRKNANHPDRNAYNEYEKKFIECRKKLLERREHLRNKRLAEIEAAKATAAASVTSVSSAGNYQYSQPPPPPPPEEEESGMEVGLFKNALSGGAASGGGIPGLDFINEEKPENEIDEEVMEVINLDDENEDKSNKEQMKEANTKPPANPVNALASLLKDPKVSALLNVISGNNNGQGVNLANLGNHELLQQIQNAAGAVINANQNGNSGQNTPNQSTIRAPEVHTPLSEDRSRTSFHDDRRSVVSIDDRSHDFDDFNRNQPPPRNNMDFMQGPPPNRVGGFGFDARVPPPLLGIDLSKPPPPIGMHPVPRPYRSDQPSPAPSNTSSTSRQRQSRWAGGNRDIKQEPDPDHRHEPNRNDFSQRPPVKEEPFNGSDCPPSDENWKYYDGHQDELQIDPELGTPCAVPKPEWMTEDEYEEIYDRYEHIDVFEERKAKMELAIELLKQKKDKDKELQTSTPIKQPFKFEDRNFSPNTSGESRWQGGMPKPFKEEPGQKRANPFASDDDFFRPKQVIDYSNGRPQPQVFDYGHSSSGPVAKDVDERNTDWRSGNRDSSGSNVPFRKDEDLRFDQRNNDWRNVGNRGDRDERQPFFRGGRGGRGGGGGRGRRFSFIKNYNHGASIMTPGSKGKNIDK